jgi:archaellum biogenesis protein FlaJ (TadC family)
MGEWIHQFVEGITWARVLWGVGIAIVAFVAGSGLVALVVVRMPSNYFHHENTREFMTGKNQVARWAGVAAKNVVGFLFVVLGVAMIVLPGPGLLTILLGIALLDFPGKRELERNIVSRPQVLQGINKLRARFDKEPLMLD